MAPKPSPLFLLLTSFLTTTLLQAMPLYEEGQPQRIHKRDLHLFIEGRQPAPPGQEPLWIHKSYELLMGRSNPSTTDWAKQYIGLGNLLSKHPEASFPGQNRAQSLQFTLGRLEQAITAGTPYEEEDLYRKYRNYARITYGQLVIKGERGDLYQKAWQYLGDVEEGSTKVGKIYQAHMLLKCDFLPEDMEYNMRGDPLIATRALELLEATHGNAAPRSALQRLHRQATALIRQEQPPAPIRPQEDSHMDGQDDSHMDARIDNLHTPQIKTLRIQLIQEARRALLEESQRTLPSSLPDLSESSRGEPPPADPHAPQPSPNPRAMHLERAHPPIAWKKEQKKKVIRLRKKNLTISQVAQRVWPLLTPEQKSHYEKGVMDKYFHDAVGRLSRKKGVRQTREKFTKERLTQIARVHAAATRSGAPGVVAKVREQFPFLSKERVIYAIKRARKLGLYPQ